MEKPRIAGDNRPQPVGCRWTTPCTACGSFLCPQAVEILRPRIHRQVTCSDRPAPRTPVDTVWTTSRSPGCGREKVTESVESGRNPALNRTPGERRATATHRGPGRVRPGFRPSRVLIRVRMRLRFGVTRRGTGRGPAWARADPHWANASSSGVLRAVGRPSRPAGCAATRGGTRAGQGPGGDGCLRRSTRLLRDDEGRPRISLRGRPRRRLRRVPPRGQPFLMRFVSSVTWL